MQRLRILASGSVMDVELFWLNCQSAAVHGAQRPPCCRTWMALRWSRCRVGSITARGRIDWRVGPPPIVWRTTSRGRQTTPQSLRRRRLVAHRSDSCPVTERASAPATPLTQLTDCWPHALAELDVELDRTNSVFIRIHELTPVSPSYCPPRVRFRRNSTLQKPVVVQGLETAPRSFS